MSLNLAKFSKEKINLIVKLITFFEKGELSADEIHHLLEIYVYTDISKDENFKGSKILDKIQEVVNIEFAFYTSNIEDLNSTPELFGEEKLKELLLELKQKLI